METIRVAMSKESESSIHKEAPDSRFELVVESAPNGMIAVGEDGKIVMVNRMAEQLFGYSREEFLELSVDDLVPNRFQGHHQSSREGYHSNPGVRQMGEGRDLFAVRKDGSEFAVEIGLTPLPAEKGIQVLATVVDISKRKQAEEKLIKYAEELKRSNQSLGFQAEILRNVHDAVFYLSETGIVREWNEGAVRVFGKGCDEVIGKSILDVCPHPDGVHPFQEKILPRVKKEGSAEEVVRCQLDSGEELVIRTKVSTLELGDEVGFVICANDITKQRRLEAEILRVSEQEQRRIGQDIHDDLCSQLSGIGMMTKAMERKLASDHLEESNMMAEISRMVADAGQKARGLAKGLLPSALETGGLSRAVIELGEQSEKLFGVNCVVAVVGEELFNQLDSSIAIQLFRIAQEAVANAMKHSDAEMVRVRLCHDRQFVTLEVKDDGKGMPESSISYGMGMMTMRQRAENIHAEFELHSALGEGTRIYCRAKV